MRQLQLRVTQPRETRTALDRRHFPTTIKPLMEGQGSIPGRVSFVQRGQGTREHV